MFNAIAKWRVILVALLLVVTTGVAVGQGQAPAVLSNTAPIVTNSAIADISPLARAVLTGDPKQVTEALEKAPDSVNQPVRAKEGARAGFTPLIIAAALSDSEIVGMLMERGAKITVLDDFNRSAFWYAALQENVEVTKRLISAPSAKEVVNIADSDFQRTPLHLAVRGNEPELVQLLIQAGASDTKKDITGKTPLDYCKRNFTSGCKYLR